MVRLVKLEEYKEAQYLFPFLTESQVPSAKALLEGLYPPIPVLRQKKKRESIQVIWGKKIIEGLCELSQHPEPSGAIHPGHLLVRLYSEEELSIKEALLIFLSLENRKDRFSWHELESLLLFMQDNSIALSFEEISQYLLSEGRFQRVEQFTRLPEVLKILVDKGKIDLKTAERVRSLPNSTLRVLEPLLEKISFSEARISLSRFYEISRRDQLEEKEAVRLAETLVKHPNPLQFLYQYRYPQIHRLEQILHHTIHPLIKGSGIKLQPPENFEGSRFTLEFSFENKNQLIRKIEVLNKLTEKIDELVQQLG
ncbi:MAG: hypothetical protein SNJ78_09670 [Spirochaetales bacterium]